MGRFEPLQVRTLQSCSGLLSLALALGRDPRTRLRQVLETACGSQFLYLCTHIRTPLHSPVAATFAGDRAVTACCRDRKAQETDSGADSALDMTPLQTFRVLALAAVVHAEDEGLQDEGHDNGHHHLAGERQCVCGGVVAPLDEALPRTGTGTGVGVGASMAVATPTMVTM